VYSYSFREQRSSQEFAFSKLIANNVVDTALIIGTDPVNSLPFDIAKNLVRINTIVVDPHKTFTSELSKVVLPSAISGVENGGTMVRSDGIRIEIKSVIEGEINDVYLLERLTEAM
jgi:formylmethanofuran dehydrogenase subunit B